MTQDAAQQLIPLFSAATADTGVDLLGAVGRVLDRHWYVLGEEVARFEEEFAHYVGVDHCVTVANGTDALELALRGLGVGPGDRVIAVANAGFYGSTAIHSIGAIPAYVDVDERTLTMSPEALSLAIAAKPAAVIATHLYGQLADIDALARIAREAGVPLVEDCAQSHGATHGGRQAGSFGRVACFSFYPTKNLGAAGDGGAVLTSDAQLAARVRTLRQYGWAQKYTVAVAGGRNSRLDEMQAAVLREKLPSLVRWNQQRCAIAEKYSRAFASLPVRCPPSLGADYVAHLYVLRVAQRDTFRDFLKRRGVSTDVHYPTPDHHQPAYSVASGALEVTEAASRSVVSLPCYPGMGDEAVARVIAAVEDFFR